MGIFVFTKFAILGINIVIYVNMKYIIYYSFKKAIPNINEYILYIRHRVVEERPAKEMYII